MIQTVATRRSMGPGNMLEGNNNQSTRRMGLADCSWAPPPPKPKPPKNTFVCGISDVPLATDARLGRPRSLSLATSRRPWTWSRTPDGRVDLLAVFGAAVVRDCMGLESCRRPRNRQLISSALVSYLSRPRSPDLKIDERLEHGQLQKCVFISQAGRAQLEYVYEH